MGGTKKRDPYKVLGVSRDASEADVRAAFRRRAKNAHPDRGGNRDEFEAVKWAQLVLSDPDRRARFDETGEADEPGPDNDHAQALQLIAKLLHDVLVGEEEPLDADLVLAMRLQLADQVKEIEGKIAVMRRARARAAKMTRRFKRRAAGDNAMARLLERNDQVLTQQTALAEKAIKHRKAAIALIEEYTFEHDAPAPQRFTDFTLAFTARSFARR
jgi:curved DNA-binding protein CbpA